VNECTWTSTSNTEPATTDTWTLSVDVAAAEDVAGDEDVAVADVRTVEVMHQLATTHPLKAEDLAADSVAQPTLELHWKMMRNSQHWVEKVWWSQQSSVVGRLVLGFRSLLLDYLKSKLLHCKNKGDEEEIVYMALLP